MLHEVKSQKQITYQKTLLLMPEAVKISIEIHYCPGCNWLPRSAWMAQELLSTFSEELDRVCLIPSDTGGHFEIKLFRAEENNEVLVLTIWERKRDGGFPGVKELKQIVRDRVSPDKDLGHLDSV